MPSSTPIATVLLVGSNATDQTAPALAASTAIGSAEETASAAARPPRLARNMPAEQAQRQKRRADAAGDQHDFAAARFLTATWQTDGKSSDVVFISAQWNSNSSASSAAV